ncbi:MAG: ABC transporter permease, partial [Rhodobacterales bacterium]|nr:ABC transporter permease [Rhodobacterales bacterium]
MLRFVLFRLMQMIFIMTGLSMVVFLIFFATPGIDPAANIAGRGASEEVLAAVRESFGLDRPLPIQYLSMMKRMLIDQDLTSFSNRSYQVLP